MRKWQAGPDQDLLTDGLQVGTTQTQPALVFLLALGITLLPISTQFHLKLVLFSSILV